MTPGKTISHYRIMEKLGGGGMGIVYRAEDLKLGREVALKFLPEEMARDRVALERFEREARAAAALNHPNICTLHEIGEHEGHPFLAMELLEGATLKHRIGNQPLPVEALLNWATDRRRSRRSPRARHRASRHQARQSFHHHAGYRQDSGFRSGQAGRLQIRRPAARADSHPPGGSPDHPRHGRGHSRLHVARTGARRGTGCPHRPFSFGVVLYQMATGRMPFQGKTSADVTAAILHQTPQPASQANPGIPPKLDDIVARAIEKDRDVRYQSGADLRAELKRLKRDLDSSRSHPVTPGSGIAAAPAPRKLRWPYAAVAAILAGAVLFWLARPVPPPRVTNMVQLTSDGRPKGSPLLTDGARLFFAGSGNEPYQVSVKGGESVPLPLPVKDARLMDISADRTQLLLGRAAYWPVNRPTICAGFRSREKYAVLGVDARPTNSACSS